MIFLRRTQNAHQSAVTLLEEKIGLGRDPGSQVADPLPLHKVGDSCSTPSSCPTCTWAATTARPSASARFLERIADGELRTARLILNGDVFDSIDFRRLNKNHWKVLSLIRKLSDHLEIIWLCGNHDGSAEIVSHLLGVDGRGRVRPATAATSAS